MLVLYLPGPQALHLGGPVTAAYLPTSQRTQSDTASSASVDFPVDHWLHADSEVEPVFALYRPAPQGVQGPVPSSAA